MKILNLEFSESLDQVSILNEDSSLIGKFNYENEKFYYTVKDGIDSTEIDGESIYELFVFLTFFFDKHSNDFSDAIEKHYF